MTGLTTINVIRHRQKVVGQMRTVLPRREFKQTLNLPYGGKRVAAFAVFVREAAVNDEMFCAGNSRSYCYFVPLRRADNEGTKAWM